MKRILATILMLVILLGTVACSPDKQEAPKGYKQIAPEDEVFDLYVPEGWIDNSATGMSGAIYSLGSGVMVTAVTQRYTGELPLDQFVSEVENSYKKALTDYETLTDPESTTLGSYAALRFDYKAKSNDVMTKFRCTVVKNETTFVILTCCAPEENFDSFVPTFDGIASNFAFRDVNFEVETEEPFILVDENTPDGFQLAAHSKYEFRLYVPETWDVDTTSGIPRAYYSDSDFSNVTLSTFAVQDNIPNAKAYWDFFCENYDYQLTVVSTDENAKLGKYNALAVEYTSEIAGIQYYTKQVFMDAPGLVYILTYTSDELHYEEHMDDVNTIISMFELKK